MENFLLSVNDVAKHYGQVKALDGVSFSVAPGRIVGLMGPNGSGKSTLLKLIAGLLRPLRGTIKVCGYPVGVQSKALVSYLHDNNPLYPSMRAIDAINYYADFFPDFDRSRACQMLIFMELKPDIRVKAMSKGMLEKLNLILAFARRTKLYLMDEPLGGIDPLARKQIVDSVVRTFRPDSAIIISTHLVSNIAHLFHDAVFIHAGKIILQGDAEKLRDEHQMNMEQLYIKLYSTVGEKEKS